MARFNKKYNELRSVVNSYVKRYPLPNKEVNHQNFVKLDELKKSKEFKTSKEIQRQYNELRHFVVLSNGGFGMKYTIRYYGVLNDDEAILDLFQEANFGIIEAVDTFDPHRGTAFTTHAFYYVRKCIIDFIKKNKLVRAPREIARNLKNVLEVQNDLYTKLGREATAEEISKELLKKNIDIKNDIIKEIVTLLDFNSAADGETFISEYNENAIPEEENKLISLMTSNLIKSISTVDEKLRDVIKLRFGVDNLYSHSPSEIKYMLELDDKEMKRIKNALNNL